MIVIVKNMNNLILERSSFTPGMFNAEMNIEGVYFVGCGWSWEEAINQLLAKIVWYFHEK